MSDIDWGRVFDMVADIDMDLPELAEWVADPAHDMNLIREELAALLAVSAETITGLVRIIEGMTDD